MAIMPATGTMCAATHALPNRLLFTDLTVVHPAAASYVAIVARTDGGAAASRDSIEKAKYLGPPRGC